MHNAAVLGNISYHFLGAPPASHFSSIFKPPPSSDDREGNIPMRHGGLPAWMSQAQNSVPVTYTDWDSLIPIKNGDEILNASLPLNNMKEVSVPLLFSSQLQPHQPPPSTAPDMSATALLQKAAQIGATATDPSFLGILGSKRNNNNINQPQDDPENPPKKPLNHRDLPFHYSKNFESEGISPFPGQDDCGDSNNSSKFFGLYGTTLTSVASRLGSEVDDIPGLSHFQMYPSKRRHIQNEEGAGGGQTRDFLGVGIQSICHPSSLNGWL